MRRLVLTAVLAASLSVLFSGCKVTESTDKGAKDHPTQAEKAMVPKDHPAH